MTTPIFKVIILQSGGYPSWKVLKNAVAVYNCCDKYEAIRTVRDYGYTPDITQVPTIITDAEAEKCPLDIIN